MSRDDKEEAWLRKMAAHLKKAQPSDGPDDDDEGSDAADEETDGSDVDEPASPVRGTPRKKKVKNSGCSGCGIAVLFTLGGLVGWWLYYLYVLAHR